MNTAAELCTFSSLTVEVLPREHCFAGLAADQLSHNMHSDIFAHVSLGQGGQPGEVFKPGKTGEGESYQQTCNRAMEGAEGLTSKGPGMMGTKRDKKSTDQGLSYYLEQTSIFI